MLVREARLEDTPALAGMVRAEAEHQLKAGAGFRMAQNADWAAYVSQRLQRLNCVILVGELNGELVGFVDLRIANKGRPAAASSEGRLRRLLLGWRRKAAADQAALVEPSSAGVINDIYVVPECRHRGIATELLRQGVAWLEDRHVSEIEAAIWAGNEASLAFFNKAGFEKARVLVRRKAAEQGSTTTAGGRSS